MPTSSPPWTSRRSSGGSPSIVSLELLERRLAGQLADHVALAGGDRQLGADRGGALGDHRQHLDAVEPHPDRAVATRPPRRRTGRSRRRACGRRPARPAAAASARTRVRKRRTASVGKVTGSASRIAPSAPDRSAMPVSAPVPSSSSSTVAWKVVAEPSPSVAAHTETAEPVSISRLVPDHPAGAAADQARRARAPRGSLPARPPAPRGSPPETNTTASSHGSPRSAEERRRCGLERGRSSVRHGREAGSDANGHDGLTDTAAGTRPSKAPILMRRVRGHRRLRPHRRGEDRRRDRARRAAARARGGPRRGVRGRDAGLRGPADPHRRGDAEEQRRLEHRLLGFVPIDATFSAGAYADARTQRSTSCSNRAAGRSSSAAPAST